MSVSSEALPRLSPKQLTRVTGIPSFNGLYKLEGYGKLIPKNPNTVLPIPKSDEDTVIHQAQREITTAFLGSRMLGDLEWSLKKRHENIKWLEGQSYLQDELTSPLTTGVVNAIKEQTDRDLTARATDLNEALSASDTNWVVGYGHPREAGMHRCGYLEEFAANPEERTIDVVVSDLDRQHRGVEPDVRRMAFPLFALVEMA